MAFAVAWRLPELAIRAALGASRQGIIGTVLRKAAAVLLVGAAAGLRMAYWLARLLQGMLIDVAPTDATSDLLAAALLLLAGLVAALVPAARAARMDPLAVLRRAG